MALGEADEWLGAQKTTRTLAARASFYVIVWLTTQTHTEIVTVENTVTHTSVLATPILKTIARYAADAVCTVCAKDAVCHATCAHICRVIHIIGGRTQLARRGIFADCTVIHAASGTAQSSLFIKEETELAHEATRLIFAYLAVRSAGVVRTLAGCRIDEATSVARGAYIRL